MSEDASRLRQKLVASEQRRAKQMELLLGERDLIRGTLGTRSRVCGHPNCRCAKGELHESKYLSAAVGGRTRQVHVPAGDEVEVAAGVERYQRWRRLRTELVDLGAQQLELVDALGQAVLKPYPPDAPIPPPKRRGRKPKGGSASQR
jgi:hypothetical protein